jgi:hypothetical protein
MLNPDQFYRSIRDQIAVNRARTPTERFGALCDLLDAAREMAPRGPAAAERRRRAIERREREREQLRETFRRMLATGRADIPAGVEESPG